MAKDSEISTKGFKQLQEQTLKCYSKEIAELIDIASTSFLFDSSLSRIYAENKVINQKWEMALLEGCRCELIRIASHIVFLTINALYRNAKEDIRFMLEFVVQSYYIDTNHPNCSLDTKWEILKEIQNKREYRASTLINDFKTGFKDDLNSEYKLLSADVHPSHETARKIYLDVMNQKGIPAEVNKQEILKIEEYMRRLQDIFYFLYFSYFNEALPTMRADKNIAKVIDKYKLSLLFRLFKNKTALKPHE
jgi:hypothetical protein